MAEVFDFGLQQHKIKMDGKFFENNLFAVAGDTGRRLEVQLLDTNGMVQNTTGLNLRLNALIAGKATFTDATLVDPATGKYQLDLFNGMFLAPGDWQFQWQITDSAGKKLHSFAFTGNVGSNISEGGSQATNFYLNLEDLKQMQEDLVNGTFNSEVLETNIAEKLTDLETQYAPKLTEVTAQLAQKADYTIVRKKADLIGVDDFTAEAQATIAGTAPIANSIPASESVTLNKFTRDLKEEFIALTSSFDEVVVSKNKYDSSLAVDNKYYNTNGSIFSSNNLAISGLAPVKPLQLYNLSMEKYTFDFIHFWNGSEWISSSTAVNKLDNGSFETPQNTTHLSFSINFTAPHNTDAFKEAVSSIQLEEGGEKTALVPYQTIKIIKKTSIPSLEKNENQRYKGKEIIAFGDSITAGTMGGYLKYVQEITQANIINKGSSGARTKRLVGMMTHIKDRDGNSPAETPDYSNAHAVFIQIGTNENPFVGTLEDIPYGMNQSVNRLPLTIEGKNITTEDEYWGLFPNNFYGNLALCIEYVKQKNPDTLIFLITPYLFHSDGLADNLNIDRMKEVRKAILEIGELYSLPVIDAQTKAGIDPKHLDNYVYDGTHLNEFGNKVWGTYIGNQLLSE